MIAQICGQIFVVSGLVLTRWFEFEIKLPRSNLVWRVSIRVLMTLLKMTTGKG